MESIANLASQDRHATRPKPPEGAKRVKTMNKTPLAWRHAVSPTRRYLSYDLQHLPDRRRYMGITVSPPPLNGTVPRHGTSFVASLKLCNMSYYTTPYIRVLHHESLQQYPCYMHHLSYIMSTTVSRFLVFERLSSLALSRLAILCCCRASCFQIFSTVSSAFLVCAFWGRCRISNKSRYSSLHLARTLSERIADSSM